MDREYVAGALEDDEARAMLVSSVGLRKDLGLSVVAEGVETQAEWDLVASVARGSAWEDGYNESFNGKLRGELLNRETFYTLMEAHVMVVGKADLE